MRLYEDLCEGFARLALVGLGYVGMPIAYAFSEKVSTIGFDINEKKIELYKQGFDPTAEIGNERIAESNIDFTSDQDKLDDAKFFIVAVPTPVNKDHTPDLRPIVGASHTVGKHLSKGAIIVYESTVYPGVTEDICIPILELESGLKCGIDFKVGYSPERINPGDKEHRLNNITKIVSGCDAEALEQIANVYELVIDAGVYKAPSIKVAEAAKVIENSQRDINIAFMNELSIIFDRMGIDTLEVLKAAGTKWNFMHFKPGLVGGHCIGVDPYYLTYKAEEMGYHSQIILSGRQINDGMGAYVAQALIKHLANQAVPLNEARVAIMGYAFKENCPDARNSKVHDIYSELMEFSIVPLVFDPVVDVQDVENIYGVSLVGEDELHDLDAIIVATPHAIFNNFDIADFDNMYRKENRSNILFDLKGLYEKERFVSQGYDYWRL